MNRTRLYLQILLPLLLPVSLPAPSLAEGPVETSQTHIRNAGKAYRDGDVETYVAELETAFRLNPASLSTRYNLACGYALKGRAEESLSLLADLARKGVDFGMTTDPDLESLRGAAEFVAIASELGERTRPLVTSEEFLTFEQYGLVPEGIARDPESGRLFFGSMRTGEIYAVDTSGQVSRFSTVDRENRLSAVGLAVDTETGLLWATGSAFELAENFTAESAVASGLTGIDLATGAIRERYPVAQAEDWLNDVVVAGDGRLFATGSGLLVSNPEAGNLQRFPTSVEVFGSNGIALADDRQTLLVASYPVGLYAVSSKSGDAQLLEPPDGTTLYGLDGIYWHDGALIAIQNGVKPWRLLRIRLDEGLSRITAVETLELGSDATTPMTGAIHDGAIYYVGETEAPVNAPSHFPDVIQENRGAVTIRKAPLRTH